MAILPDDSVGPLDLETPVVTQVQTKPKLPTANPMQLAGSGPYFAALLLIALVAFWPSYLSQVFAQSNFTHLHAIVATVWLLFLIAQPLAIRTRRKRLHRAIGRLSYVVAPIVILSVVLLAHDRMQGLEGQRLAIQTYILYLQLSLAFLFAVLYGMAIINRHNMPVHMRFMICTGLTFIDPIVVRFMLWAAPVPSWNYQWFTFALTNAILLTLIWLDRKSTRGRWVFPAALGLFLLLQIPAVFGLTSTGPWQSFAAYFAALGLTR